MPATRRRRSASANTELSGPEDRLLRVRHRAVERYLASALPRATTLPRELHEAMRYATLGPGKRMRPLLVITACEAVGGEWRKALPAAAAVELVHAFSLVHDDLPAMDDDDYRRGRLTTHKKYGEAVAILAGDALFALAFKELARLEDKGLPARRVLEATRCLAAASGSPHLVGGQVLDLIAENRTVTRRQVREIHARKTGALVKASLEMGAIAGRGTRRQVERLGEIGAELGIAFQIHDDLLNEGSSLARLGKRAGTDAARGKATWPRATGSDRAREDAARMYSSALERIASLGPRGRTLAQLVMAVAERQS